MPKLLDTPVPVQVKESLRKFAEQATGWEIRDSGIKKISVRAFSRRIKKYVTSDISVGEELDTNLSNMPHEPVVAIFESRDYLVVTPDKCKCNGTVYLFQEKEVLGIERE